MIESIDSTPRVPAALIRGIERYVQYGIPPGSCLRAILEGDLFTAFAAADPGTRASMGAIVQLITCSVPRSIIGSPEAVSLHIELMRRKHASAAEPTI